MAINIMPPHLAELIAAGEVVERPASVVKELLENSIDAGADTVTLEIRNGGISYIRITDNGCGIPREDVPKAFISHATSKISTAEDLDSILTLGFRGEALPSIAAVAGVEMLTRTRDEDTGTRYCIEYGEEVLIDDAGCPTGTTITVRDIFRKTPARMKFLKKDVTEANAVAAVVDRIALSNPGVSFRFIREGKQTLMTSGKGDLLTCIREVFGKEFASELIPCRGESQGVKVSGYVSKPEYSRPNRNMQFFFLNGRFVKTGTGSAALSEGYRNSIMVGKFPSCVLSMEVSPSAVDVNVHPAKTEVRFSDERPVFNAVYAAVKNALAEGDSPRQIHQIGRNNQAYIDSFTKSKEVPAEQLKMPSANRDFWQHIPAEKKNDAPAPVRVITPAAEQKKAEIPEAEPAAEKKTDSTEDMLLRSPSAPKPQAPEPPVPVKQEETTAEEKPAAPVFDEDKFRLIGEAFRTYILCEYDGKIVIIDKHAAHERIIYERLKRDSGERSGQILLTPVTVTLSKDEYSAVTENLELINSSGFEAEDFGSGCIIVRECPMELSPDDVPGVMAEIAGRFVEKRQDVMFEKLDWIFHSVACRSAIKAGNITSEYELEKFAKQLLSMPDIRYCPHGRPVLIEMTQRELEKNFGRI